MTIEEARKLCVDFYRYTKTATWIPDDNFSYWHNKYTYQTTQILQENGQDVMNQSYAELKAGDGIVYFTSAGHVVTISGDAHVEYGADGKIDPAKSYVTVLDQTQTWRNGTNEAGDAFQYMGNLDAKKEYTVKITVQLGTGERPTVWEGKLA